MKLFLLVIIILYAPLLQAEQFFSLDENQIKQITKNHDEYAVRRLRAWLKLIEENQECKEYEKLSVVNQFINLMEYQSDMLKWGESDYWATPVEFILENGGDCEDFSLAKYFTLRALGIADAKLQITYVKAIELNQAHMVLTYFKQANSDPLVLDNLNGQILPASLRRDLLPIYSFNGQGLWKAKKSGIGRRLGDSSKIKRWKNLQQRLLQGL